MSYQTQSHSQHQPAPPRAPAPPRPPKVPRESNQAVLKQVKIAFPRFNPEPRKPYRVSLLFCKGQGTGAPTQLRCAMREAYQEPLETILRDGDSVTWKGFKGFDYIDTSTFDKPRFVDQHNQPMDPSMFKSGDWCDAVVRIVVRGDERGPRYFVNLEAIRFFQKGEGF